MKLTKFLTLFFVSIILNSCNTLGEAGKILRNEKTNTTDEFLIKKNEPLTQPPDFNEIPQPGSVKDNKAGTEQNSFEKILKTKKSDSKNSQTKSSSTEESILQNIKK